MHDVIVIGAGHNGLVAACYLARAGLDVLVVEAADAVGGCTTTATLIPEAPDHRINPCAVDMCLLRGSGVVADLELHRFGFQEREVDPSYVGLDAEGASLAIWRDPRRTAEEIRRFSHHDAKAYLEFARTLEAATDVMFPLLLSHPTRPAPRNLLAAAWGGARQPRRLSQLMRFFTASAPEVIEERFRHPMVQGALAVMTGVAGPPITLDGTAANLLFFGFVHRLGVSRLLGGTQALPDALSACLAASGGHLRTSAAVEELLTSGEHVRGVRLHTGEELTARAVLASCDPHSTLTRLLPPDMLPEPLAARAARIPIDNLGAAYLKVDVALSGRLELPRHQAWRGDGLDLRRPAALVGTLEQMCDAFAQAAAGGLADPLPFAGVVPTAVDPSQAPAGQDTCYLWAGWAPRRPSEGWDALAAPAGKALLAHAGQYYEGIEAMELGRWVETPPDFVKRLRAPHAYHVDLSLFRNGPLRPAAGFAGYRTPVPGLFLTGGGTHPGPSVSGVPGRLAARTVMRTLRKQ
jgi:phytoene dehydrogenase-like protein